MHGPINIRSKRNIHFCDQKSQDSLNLRLCKWKISNGSQKTTLYSCGLNIHISVDTGVYSWAKKLSSFKKRSLVTYPVKVESRYGIDKTFPPPNFLHNKITAPTG